MRMVRPQKSAALFVLILALLLSTSFAGGQRRFFDKHSLRQHGKESGDEKSWEQEEEQVAVLHARMLKVKTDDYGGYDPSPSLDKPHFKLIPN